MISGVFDTVGLWAGGHVMPASGGGMDTTRASASGGGRRKLAFWAGIVLLFVTLFLALIFMMLTWAMRNHEYRCGLNLKSLAMGHRMYAAYHDDVFPPPDPEPGVLMADRSLMNPDYLGDPLLLFSRADPFFNKVSSRDPSQPIPPSSFVYLGRAVHSDEDVAAWWNDYQEAVASGDASLGWQPWKVDEAEEAATPLLIELPNRYPGDLSMILTPKINMYQSPDVVGGMVAYCDGRVVFLTYPGSWPMTKTTISILREARGMHVP
jgi:hypothetical protein